MEKRAMNIIEKAESHLLIDWNDHLLAYWTGNPNPKAIASVVRAVVLLSARHPSGKCAHVCTLLDGFHLPDGPTRKEILDAGPKMDNKIHGFGVIIPGKGFGAAALRGFVTTITQLTRSKFPVPTFENAELLDGWFRSRVEKWSAPGELARVDAEIRRTHYAQTNEAGRT